MNDDRNSSITMSFFPYFCRRRCNVFCSLVSFSVVLIVYFFLLPLFARLVSPPLFCDETPCQSFNVSLHGFLDRNNVPRCEFRSSYALTILVLSQQHEHERRQTIRTSWGLPRVYRDTKVNTFFLLGRPKGDIAELVYETKDNNDIIFADLNDTYQNLTRKVLHGLSWASTHCSGSSFLVKVDSDVFFNPFPLIDYFHQTNLFVDRNVEFLGGSICHNCMPRRSIFDQWAVSFFLYPHSVFPDYIHGPCYVASRRTVERLLLAYPRVRMLPVEDVYWTGVVAGMYLGTERVQVPGFLGYNGRVEFDSERYATTIIASHKHSIEEVRDWWKQIVRFRIDHNLL